MGSSKSMARCSRQARGLQEARKKAEWETHFAKQDAQQQSENSKDFGYERAAVGHDKPVL